tara:strand:+ start:354 stop:674 length:321 start_codon:yes stop_codon:yes gene_type:complete
MNFFIFIFIVIALSFLNKKYLYKLQLSKKINDFKFSLKNLKNKKGDYTKTLDEISLRGTILIIAFLIILVPWAFIFLLSNFIGIEQFLGFLFATIPYLVLINYKRK